MSAVVGLYTTTPFLYWMTQTSLLLLLWTQEWEIYNFSGDAHPMHLHLVGVYVVGRYPITYDSRADEDGFCDVTDPAELNGKEGALSHFPSSCCCRSFPIQMLIFTFISTLFRVSTGICLAEKESIQHNVRAIIVRKNSCQKHRSYRLLYSCFFQIRAPAEQALRHTSQKPAMRDTTRVTLLRLVRSTPPKSVGART